jgi:hypothetical protein
MVVNYSPLSLRGTAQIVAVHLVVHDTWKRLRSKETFGGNTQHVFYVDPINPCQFRVPPSSNKTNRERSAMLTN